MSVLPVAATASYRPVLEVVQRTGTASLRAVFATWSGNPVQDPSATIIDRETTEQEHLIALLRDWETLDSNWDGDGACRPNINSLRAASNFVCLLPLNASMPEPLLHATGRAGLTWGSIDDYGELEFLGEQKIAYYFSRPSSKHKGVIDFDGIDIPEGLFKLIPKNDEQRSELRQIAS
jgi:hypothetical protein